MHSNYVARLQKTCASLPERNEGKPMLTVMLSDNLVAGGLKAGNLVKEAAKLIQGGGGGQPHFATAGGKNIDGLNAAIEKVLELAGI